VHEGLSVLVVPYTFDAKENNVNFARLSISIREYHMVLSFSNIQPVSRKAKEEKLNQSAKVIWMTGLSGSGKTTIALLLERELFNRGFLVQLLDGDLVRSGINNNLKFSVDDRTENIRRIAEISKLFIHCGVITINCFISPTNAIRAMAKDIIGSQDFLEVFMNSSLAVCEARDPKGLYAKARSGEIREFTGIDSPFEIPENPDLELKTDELTVEETLAKALDFILPVIQKS
jgi:adenylylsulfate kinase